MTSTTSTPTKICTQCQKELPEICFRTRPSGTLRSDCRECEAKYKAQYQRDVIKPKRPDGSTGRFHAPMDD